MNYTYLHYQTALVLLHGIGPRKARVLLNHFDDLGTLFHETPENLALMTGLKASLFRSMKRKQALEVADRAIQFHKKNGISSIHYTDPAYSRRLNQCADAPLQLFAMGALDLNEARFVAVVGTRSATSYGKEICRQLIASFRNRNIVVVSGLALGIDAWVHKYCLEYGVPTIAVLGHGMDRIYPAVHRKLAREIMESGALLTEFVPGTQPDRENFPRRNRIVAGLCDATIVVESKESGGSLITANIANSYNRDVFAFPGPIFAETSKGCNALIAQSKAHLLEGPEGFLSFMQWEEKTTTQSDQMVCFPELSATQQEIVQIIQTTTDIQLDVLAAQLAMPVSSLQVELLHLKIAGIVEEHAGKQFRMSLGVGTLWPG